MVRVAILRDIYSPYIALRWQKKFDLAGGGIPAPNDLSMRKVEPFAMSR